MIKRSRHELYEDNMAAADAMAREADELRALTDKQREEELAWTQHQRDELLAEMGIEPQGAGA